MKNARRDIQWGPAIRDHYLFHYVISGKGRLVLNNTCYHIGRGDLFLIRPSVVASYAADMDEPWEYCWVGFNGTEAERIIGLTAFHTSAPDASLCEPRQPEAAAA